MTSALQNVSAQFAEPSPAGIDSQHPVVFAKPATLLRSHSPDEKIAPATNGTVALSGFQPHGIGQGTARQFLAEGKFVICCDQDDSKGQAALREIDSDAIRFVHADLADPSGVNKFLDAIAEAPGPLHGLVCNAGSAGDPKEDDLLRMSFEHFHRLLNNNLTSAWLLTRGVLQRYFLPQRAGAVVFLGSNNGQRGCGILGQPGYGMAKTALSGLLANFVARFGRLVRFNLVRPGVVQTRSKNWEDRTRKYPKWPAIEGQATPAGRLAEPADVAHLVSFLLSDKARHINGAEIPIDGGMTCAGIQFPGIIDPTRFRESYVEAMSAWPFGDSKSADADDSENVLASADLKT